MQLNVEANFSQGGRFSIKLIALGMETLEDLK